MCNWRGGATAICIVIIVNTESAYGGCMDDLRSNKGESFLL